MLHMIFGGAGSGKSVRLMQEIRDAVQAGHAVRTLVPEQFAYTYDTMLYDRLGAAAFNRLKTGSFRSLTAELLTYAAVEPRDAADDVAKTVVLHRILQTHAKQHSLLFYGRQADKAAFHADMARQLTELMQSGNSPELLLETAAALETEHASLSGKLMDIARIYADYLTELERRGLRDVLCDPMTAAAAADGTGYLKGTYIFLDEFESFTGDQLAMLEVMLRDAAEVYIALRTDDPDADSYTRFDAVNQTVQRLRRMAREVNVPAEEVILDTQYRFADDALRHLSDHIFTSQMPPFPGECGVTIVRARDTTLEVEYTAAQIRRLLQSGAYRAKDIAIVTHDLNEYGFQLEAALGRYDIPYFMDLRRSVLYTAVMKLPLCLLSLMQRTTTEQVLLLLKTQLSPLHPAEAADLENYVYTWDIEGRQWEQTFVPETDPNARMENIRQKLMPPVLRMRSAYRKKAETGVTGAELCALLYQCIDALGIPNRIGGLAARMKEQGDVQGGRALRRLWNRFTELLDALHEAMTDMPATPQQMLDLMTTVLRSDQIPVPPQTLDAVTVQSTAAARYDAPKAVFVLGVNDGKFPADIQAGGFFTEKERALLSDRNITLSRSVRELCADERLIAYKTLSAPSERLWLCYALAGENGTRMNPSPLLQDVEALLPHCRQDNADSMGAAFYVSTRAAAYYSYVQDYDISETERAAVRQMLADCPEEAARLERLRDTGSPARLRVSSAERMRRLTGDHLQMSATFIENTMKCPFLGFCSGGLRLYEREKKNLGALSAGNLVHFCMERLFQEHPDRADFLAMTPADLQAHANRCAELFLQQELGGGSGRPQRFLQQYARMTRRMTLLLQHTQDEMRQSAFTPDACELVIGHAHDEDGTAPYQLALPGGMMLYLNGKIDRVDITEQDGTRYLRIVDYKTGEKQFRLGDIYYGLNLQMLLYLFALLDDPAAYPGAKPAGVLYMPAGTPNVRGREDNGSAEDYLRSYFRMSGTVLLDRGILTRMEQEIAGVYIPAMLSREDDGGAELRLTAESQVFTAEQLGRLREHVETLVRSCAASYAAGDVAPKPMKKKQKSSGFYAQPCDYCQYKGICGVTDADTELMRLPMTDKEADAAMLAIMNGEEVQAE